MLSGSWTKDKYTQIEYFHVYPKKHLVYSSKIAFTTKEQAILYIANIYATKLE